MLEGVTSQTDRIAVGEYTGYPIFAEEYTGCFSRNSRFHSAQNELFDGRTEA